jgi:acetyl-CoA C-acetyltransferase
MAKFDTSAPVIVAVGEASRKTVLGEWPTPTQIAGSAIRAALADSGAADMLAAAIDCVVATRSFEDSGVSVGTGSPDNVPESYAKAGGVSATRYIYGDIGGQSPQALVNQIAGALRRGEMKAALLVSAEANGTAKRARKAGIELDWRMASDTAFEDQRADFAILDRAEIRHGIVSMPLAYSLIENARMAKSGLGHDVYSAGMAALWSAFSQKSLNRQHAQFPKHWSAKALMEDADGNYQLTDIYRRWMVAQDAVDVGAALILTTAGTAQELGIAPDKMVWLTGAAEASEPPISARGNIAGSDALCFAMGAALDQAAITATALGPIDLYSCFPCAVSAGIDALGDPARALGDYTLTGGLTFFGGPGNGYAVHSLVAVVQGLRTDRSRPAMVTANGGVMSKQAVGIYGPAQPELPWSGDTAKGYQAKSIARDDAPDGKARILSYVRPVTKDVAGSATLLLEMVDGARALAVLDDSDAAHLAGRIVNVSAGEKRHIAQLVS